MILQSTFSTIFASQKQRKLCSFYQQKQLISLLRRHNLGLKPSCQIFRQIVHHHIYFFVTNEFIIQELQNIFIIHHQKIWQVIINTFFIGRRIFFLSVMELIFKTGGRRKKCNSKTLVLVSLLYFLRIICHWVLWKNPFLSLQFFTGLT